ncbi:hypothetical protein CBR_g3920 [Chara braunii]|uniref:Uncharacterized protein n=1 Tax=Chara braunii TaxID=69332 RepID=A0A388KGQ2_CHABU|nr:hypothetical protein CBR_g3920 [Chara braunii]|eukprot:GBG69221.1 hypothetical protein CBR_g3920 [Chara braunii]
MFGGYDRRAMSLPHFLPLAPGHNEAVHVTDFLKVWAKSGTYVSAVDVGPGTSISGPVGFAGGECSEREMGGQGGLPATPPDQEVGMSDDLEDDHPRAPLKPGLHVSRRHGLLGESTPHGGGDGERLRQGSKSTTPRCLVERIGSFVRGLQVAEVSPGDRAGGRGAKVGAVHGVGNEEDAVHTYLEPVNEAKKRKEWAEKLRYYLPLAMADDSVFALGLKFYEEWSKGKLLASDGRRWTEKSPTHEEVAKPGLSTVTDRQGLKKHVWYVKVDDPSLKKGRGKPKKGAEEKTFYVQVPEPDVHCWKELVDLTDREKKRLLNGVLNLNVVWVQTSSKKLVEQGKFSVKEMVDIIKMDRIMLELWHYVEFEYEEMDKREWNANSMFFRSKKQLFEEFKDRGLDDKLWNESRKFFTDTTYVNKCPQFLGCQHDNNIKRTAALVNDQHFPAEWKRVVLSVITGDHAKGKKKPRGIDECINIMWTRTSAFTTLAQFNVDPLSAIDHKQALGKLGHQLRSHTCVLDLCGDVDRVQWDSGAFASLTARASGVESASAGKARLGRGCGHKLEYTVQYVTHEVSSKTYPCNFHHVVVEPVYDPNKDMFFKLTPKKSRQVYSFLYGEQPRLRFDPQYVVRKEVAIAVLQGYHGASRASAVSFIKRLEYVFFNEDVVDPADFTLDKYKLVFSEEDDFNIETEQEESVEDDLFDLDGQFAIFNAQVSESPSVCKPGTPLATPTSGDHFQPVLLDDEWAVAVRDVSGGWIYDDRWDLETFKSRAYDAVLERLNEVNRRNKDDLALREYGDTLFEFLQSNKWLEVSSAFYALPSSPSIKQVSWELLGVTPPAGVVKRKSRGKNDDGDGEGGGQRGTEGGSEQRSMKQRSPGHAGGEEGRKGSREKKKPRSGEKTKYHRGDGQGSDVDRDEDGGVLAVTSSTSMEMGNDLRPGCITWPGEQDPVISSTSETQFVDAVGGADVAKHGTCFAQLQIRLADCLGSIRTSETTSLSGTQCLPGSETTTYHRSGSDKLEPCSVSPQKEFWINPNREGTAVYRTRTGGPCFRKPWQRNSDSSEPGSHVCHDRRSVSGCSNVVRGSPQVAAGELSD